MLHRCLDFNLPFYKSDDEEEGERFVPMSDPLDEKEVCCESIYKYVSHPKYSFFYNRQIREYHFFLGGGCVLWVEYCPWCGTRLPGNLRTIIFVTLEKELNIELNLDELQTDPRIPEEFKTDEWWKKRGL